MDAEGEYDLRVVQSLTLLAIFEYTGARCIIHMQVCHDIDTE